MAGHDQSHSSSPPPEMRGVGLADLCIKRPVFATMINLFLVVLGWFSFKDIGIDQFPNVELPIITVTTTLRGASPEEMETSVTKPLEEIINTIQGIDELGSVTTEGVSQITVQFLLERNRDIAAQDVRDKVNTILARLPPGTDPPIIDKFDLDAIPVISISVSAPRDLKEISYITDRFIKQNLETVSDVGSISMVGARTRAVQDSVELPRTLSRARHGDCVTLIVRKQSGSNTVKVIDGVKKRLAELRAVVPADFQLEVIRDQSRFIERSLEEINFHLILGAMLVALTTFFFMHDWRGTVIACVAIPASIISTFALMRAMGYTLNNFTMLGLVFAVGIVIDDAIVVLENIHRTMEEKGWSGVQSASYATREIALAVMAMTLSLVVIFLPLAFMKGRVGMFFSSYGVTVAFAIMVSLFVSFTLTPMLASRFLKHTSDPILREKKAHGGALMQWMSRHYLGVLRWSLHHRWAIMLASGLCFVSIIFLGKLTRFTFIPQDDSSEFEISLQTPEGSDLESTIRTCDQIETRLKSIRLGGQQAITDTL